MKLERMKIPRDDPAHLGQQLQEGGPAAAPGHGPQHPGVRVLQGHVQVLGAVRGLADGAQEAVGEPVGVGVVDPEPAQARDRAQFPDQLFQGVGVAQVAAEIRGVLAHEVDLQDPLGHQAPGFGHHRGHRPAALGAADGRDDAEGALVVAALADLQVGAGPGGGQQPGAVLVVEVARVPLWLEQPVRGPDHFGDVLDVPGAQAGVDLRHVGQQLVPVALHHASGHQQLAAGAGLLVGGRLEDGLDALLLGAFDESAGVDHQHLGLGRIRGDGEPLEPQVPEHHLAIHQILGAPQGHETDLRHPDSLPGQDIPAGPGMVKSAPRWDWQ